MKTIMGIAFLVLTLTISISATEQSLEEMKQDLKEELRSEMREEMRRLQDRMTEACEQRIETPFAVYDQKFTQKIDEMRIQIRTLEETVPRLDTKIDTKIGGLVTNITNLVSDLDTTFGGLFLRLDTKIDNEIGRLDTVNRNNQAEQKKIVEEGREMDYEIRQLKKKVIFSALKKGRVNFDGLITFDTIDVNVGDGLQANGKFIAPESGTYGFTFSGVTGIEKSFTMVKVYKDGNEHHVISDANKADILNNINGSWMMKLAKGQVVHLEVIAGRLYGKLYAGSSRPVIFTGNLLMLDE